VAILYGGPIFACRHCYGLVYRTQRQEDYERLDWKAEKIRARLGWRNRFSGGKRKGMRWRTFERLVAEHDALTEEAWRRAGLV
jgi:hypothetical protein